MIPTVDDMSMLVAARPALERQLERIAAEKRECRDNKHTDCDCGFQLLSEILLTRLVESKGDERMKVIGAVIGWSLSLAALALSLGAAVWAVRWCWAQVVG